jgi:CHAD domain-containing protein
MVDSGYVKLKEIKLALASYVSEAHALVRSLQVPDEEAVHDIRVLMKKARATVRLLESQIADELFLKENESFREIGKLLTISRETAVQRKTLKLLRKDNKDLFRRLSENKKVMDLLEKHENPEGEAERQKAVQLDELLSKAVARIRFYNLDNLDPRILLQQLEKTYIIASGIYLDCRFKPKPSSLHELRKRSKDLLYQIIFFRPLNPEAVRHLESKLDSLTQNLGKYNDLTQILNLLEYNAGSPENDNDLNELAVVIKNKQDEYLEKIWPQAFKIFCPGQRLVSLLGFKILTI